VDSADSSTQPEKTKRSRFLFTALLLTGLALGTYLVFSNSQKSNIEASLSGIENVELSSFPMVIPTMKYGFAIDTFQVTEAIIEPNQFLADLLQQYNIDYLTVEKLATNAKDVFDIRHLRAGKPYTILSKDTTQAADYFIYEPSVYEYIVFDLKNDLQVKRVERPINKEVKTASGVVESSLWQAMTDNGLSYELTAKMEDALQWSVDFHHIQKGDAFNVVFEQNYIEGKPVGVGNVYAAHYQTLGNEFYAVWFDETEDVKIHGYYDLEGRPMNKGFLKAPVKYSRISSYYNPNRFHPILKRRRPHYGTDYAAPYGTPIYAVGDGVVVRSGYTKGNGNFVKIKHDDTYQTQYLHMQKFAKGIGNGVHVHQGQVIGYVGSTGLATGPHVCFRFWKNNKQVNHLKLKFPPPEPLPEEHIPAFEKIRDQYLDMLAGLAQEEL
jgi:murein DD-endopeptidase MepM/ murein hydrolase activator NlpD